MVTGIRFVALVSLFSAAYSPAVIGQSDDDAERLLSAMHPRFKIGGAPVISGAASITGIVAEAAYQTYIGGEGMDQGIAAHEFPDGTVVVGVQTPSKGLPITQDAIRKKHSGTGDDWYVVHFDPSSREIIYATYLGTEAHDWLSDVECDDLTRTCLFVGGTEGDLDTGKEQDDIVDVLIELLNFAAPAQHCEAEYGDGEGDHFGNGATNAVWQEGGATGGKAAQLGLALCGFRQAEDQINGLVALVDEDCGLTTVFESSIETDDTFYECYAEPGPEGGMTVRAVGVRDQDANRAVDGPPTPIYCYTSPGSNALDCADMPPSPAEGKRPAAASDYYLEIDGSPGLGTFALGFNTMSGYGFIDFWPSTDPSVVTTTEPWRYSTGPGFPSGFEVSRMGRVSFVTDYISNLTAFGRIIGTYFVRESDEPTESPFDFLNWKRIPGSTMVPFTTDLNSHPFGTSYTGFASPGIDMPATALNSDCPGEVCAVYGQVQAGLGYVSACNMSSSALSYSFNTTVPSSETECCGFFFTIESSGEVGPDSCSQMLPWPFGGGFSLGIASGGFTGNIDSNPGPPSPFTTVIVTDGGAESIEVSDLPGMPRTFTLNFVNTLDDSINMNLAGSAEMSLGSGDAAAVQIDPALLGTEILIDATTNAGARETSLFTVPTGDFFYQVYFVNGQSGKRQSFDIRVFDELGTSVDVRVSTATEGGQVAPLARALYPNYPNPFSETTSIPYILSDRSSVEVVIFNVFGQRVRKWSSDVQSAGRHTVSWDGTDALGSPVASGVYLVRLSVPEFSQTRVMFLLR